MTLFFSMDTLSWNLCFEMKTDTSYFFQTLVPLSFGYFFFSIRLNQEICFCMIPFNTFNIDFHFYFEGKTQVSLNVVRKLQKVNYFNAGKLLSFKIIILLKYFGYYLALLHSSSFKTEKESTENRKKKNKNGNKMKNEQKNKIKCFFVEKSAR